MNRLSLFTLLLLMVTASAPAQERMGASLFSTGKVQGETGSALRHADDLFTEARALESGGKLEEAYTLYRHAWLTDPNHYRSLYHGGRLLESIGRVQEAEMAFRESIRLAPDFYPACNALGMLLIRQDRYRDASDAFTSGTLAAPDYAPAWRNLGRSQIEMNDLDAAIASWSRALQLEAADLDARTTLGLLLLQKGDTGQAEAQFRQVLSRDPSHARALHGLALSSDSAADRVVEETSLKYTTDPLLERGMRQSEDPIWLFEAPDLELANPDRLKEAGYERLRRGEYALAVDLLTRSREHGGPDPEALAALAYAHYILDNLDQAAEVYGDAARAMETPPGWLYVNRGIALLEAGKLNDATRAFGYAVKVDPTFARGWYALGRGRLERGQNRRALHALRQAAALEPFHPDILAALALAQLRLGKERDATATYRRAVLQRPGDPALLISLARLLEVRGRPFESAEYYSAFLDAAADDPRFEPYQGMAQRKIDTFDRK